ncbi:MAG TPA: archease [Streptosporangiaceae bacterium]|nr:archease [Streptosporangiaceae bacterium]
MTASGHRSVPHTADLRIEAWAESRDECLAQAASGLVASFAEVTDDITASRTAEVHLTDESDEDLLAAVLDEIIYRVDADDQVPVAVTVWPAADGGVSLRLELVDLDRVTIIGAAPKAVSLHEIRCSADPAGDWSCTAIVDV